MEKEIFLIAPSLRSGEVKRSRVEVADQERSKQTWKLIERESFLIDPGAEFG